MTVTRSIRISNCYRDSVALMQLSRHMLNQEGIVNAAVMMGTPANLEVMEEAGLLPVDRAEITPDELVLTVKAVDETRADGAIQWVRAELLRSVGLSSSSRPNADRSASGEEKAPGKWSDVSRSAQLALISTPGEFAVSDAWRALRSGLHVFLFSDHIGLSDEVALKKGADERQLLMMGSGCGTAIIGGIPLGFANAIRRGQIGVVAASGSGLQELTCLIDRAGYGISHAIGTGGRDLHREVGGITMRRGIQLLSADPETEVFLLISKPVQKSSLEFLLEDLRSVEKPIVICFLGMDTATALPGREDICFVKTLEEAAGKAIQALGGQPPVFEPPDLDDSPRSLRLMGLYTGGTLAYEALVVLNECYGPVWSNAPLDPAFFVRRGTVVDDHMCLDLGAEEYTLGQPHPMIDPSNRTSLLIDVAHMPKVGLILTDLILGFGGHPDPVGELLSGIDSAREVAAADNRRLVFVTSVVGTDHDRLPRSDQVRRLVKSDVIVAPSNACAARIAAHLMGSKP